MKNISGNKYFMNLVENMSEAAAAAAGWAHKKKLYGTQKQFYRGFTKINSISKCALTIPSS